MQIKVIAAICKENNGIGFNNSIPWKCKTDMKFFSEITKGSKNNAVLMGYNTWKSINGNLKDRVNIVITSRDCKDAGSLFFKDIDKAIQYCKVENFEILWIIGGAKIYEVFLRDYINMIDECVITFIPGYYECDTFFPKLIGWKKYKEVSLGNYEISVNYYNRN